jgi:hypothetical protein
VNADELILKNAANTEITLRKLDELSTTGIAENSNLSLVE